MLRRLHLYLDLLMDQLKHLNVEYVLLDFRLGKILRC